MINIPSSEPCARHQPTEAERGQVQTLGEDTRQHYHLHVTLVPSLDQQALTCFSVKINEGLMSYALEIGCSLD